MQQLTIFGTTLGHPPTSDCLFSKRLASLQERSVLAPYRRIAVRLLIEQDLELPGWDTLTLLIESALASRDLYFAAALEKPGPSRLAQHFEAFVLACVLPSHEGDEQ